MRNLNAEVIRVHGNYDNSLKECIKQSEENNWEIVQDVSWDGYKEVPKLIMAGYTIMIKEIIDQVDTNSITHVFLQAGVGGMAAAMIAGFAKLSKNIPKFIVVEPENADCVFKSIQNNRPTSVDIKKETVMGGMSCGDVSSVAWEILKNSANYCVTITDEAISSAVALLAEGRLSNEKIIAGECAVPGIIALIGAYNNKDYLNKLELNSDSKVLLFGCEGLTDKEMYKKLLDDGLKKI
jgi:diaminopropionate ammonia-lyase